MSEHRGSNHSGIASHRNRSRTAKVVALAATAAVIGLADYAGAATANWVGPVATPSPWETPANWDTVAVPTSSDDAFINNGGIADITGTTGAASVNKLRLGAGVGNSGTLNIATGGSLHSATNLWIGGDDDGVGGFLPGTGTLNINGGTLTTQDFAAHIAMGYGGTANFSMTGGTMTSGLGIYGANRPNSTFTGTQSGGSITAANGVFWLGDGLGSTSTYTMSGGSIAMASSMGIGAHGTATFNMSTTNGSSTITIPSNLQIGDSPNGVGTLNMSGGTITTNWVLNGHQGDGTINLSGGLLETNIFTLGQHSSISVPGSSPTGIINHTGGTLKIKSSGVLSELSTEANLYDLNGGFLDATNSTTSNITVRVGAQGTATMKIRHANSLANIGRNLIVGGSAGNATAAANSTGNLEISAGTLNVGTGTAGDGILALGNVGRAFVTISGGTTTADAIWTGYGAGSNTVVTQGKGEVTQSGGSVTSTTDFDIGRATSANNFWEITGGSITVADELTVARFTTDPAIATSPSPTLVSNGRFTVDGGTVSVTGQMSSSLGFTQTTGANTGKLIPGGTGLIEVKSGSLTAGSFLNGQRGDPSLPASATATATYVQTGGTANVGHVSGFGTVSVSGGTMDVKSMKQSSATITGGTVKVAADSTNAATSDITALAISGTGKLDLTNNKLVTQSDVGSWNGSAYTGVTGLVQSGRGGGAGAAPFWDGSTGIVTSESSATGSVLTSLAVAKGSELFEVSPGVPIGPTDTATWGGQTVNGDSTLVMYTWGGDAELDGDLDGDDYFWIDSNVGLSGTSFGYHQGDFDYDGDIDGDDYFIIDSNIAFAQTQPNWPTGSGVAGLTAVPEPTSLAVLAAAGAGLALRRRRRDANC